MKKIFSLLTILFVINANAQVKNDTTAISGKDVLDALKLDDFTFLKSARDNSCGCIEKIKVKKKSKEKLGKEIKDCIDKEVESYQMMQQMFSSMNSKDTAKRVINITINPNKNSMQYQRYYFEIERELRDSCETLKTMLGSNEKGGKNSISKNDDAIYFYTEGQRFMKNEEYETAIQKYTESLKIDPKFAFAWDNLGICYRKLGKYDDAINSYTKSLELDPKGMTALQNIAVAYSLKKDYGKSVEIYSRFVSFYPNDPEGFYGLGQAYSNQKNYNAALDNMCKAYNLYIKMGSPYRTDAEREIQGLYQIFKKDNKENDFNRILKENNINPNKK